ncbi:alpha/beta fold hydrolase [Herbiconiux sp. A18JL235]|uniref:Alpha/beta fold hydrolase n=1 Tax=Herbiconiux sp. A18JL235 TaxID=3152363 RepID=A0AB39BJL0_9MICO
MSAGTTTRRTPTVVIVPGIGMSHRYSRRLAAEIGRTGSVLTLDLPGFAGHRMPDGTLPPPQHLTVPHLADAVLRALGEHDIADAVLVGHSMGAQIAAEAAAREQATVRGETARHESEGKETVHEGSVRGGSMRGGAVPRIRGLVLAAPVVDPSRRSAAQQTADLLRDTLFETPTSVALIAADYLRTRPRRFGAALRRMLDYRLEDTVAGWKGPVLVLRGSNDPIARREWCEQLAHRAAHGALVELDGPGHVLQHTDAPRVAREIEAFLALRVGGIRA